MILCPFRQLRRYAAVIPGLEDAHAPGKHLEAPNDYKKIVRKLAA